MGSTKAAMDNLRRLAGLVVLLLPATFLPLGRSEAGRPSGGSGQIILMGRGPSYVDVVLDKKITPYASAIEVTTTGTYAGFVITEYRGDLVSLVGGSYVVPSFVRRTKKAGGGSLGVQTLVQNELHPGAYRFQLITDGVATVKIPTEGLSRSMRLSTKHVARAQSALDFLGNGPGDMEARWPLRRTKATVTVLNLLQIVEDHHASFLQQCLKDGSENFDNCQAPAEDYGGWWLQTTTGSEDPGWIFDSFGYYPGYEVGEYTGVQRVAQAVEGSANYAFFLNVPLTAPRVNNIKNPAPGETFSFPYQLSGAQGQTFCRTNLADVGTCGSVEARPTDHRATVKIVDAAGGPTAATVTTGRRTIEICGETTDPLKVVPGADVSVNVLAHPTPDCPLGHGTTGSVEVTLGP
jgi:hypothetical protein